MNKQIKEIFNKILETSKEPTNEPTTTAKAIGQIQAYAEIGSSLIEDDHDQMSKELKAYDKETRSRIKIVAYLATNGEKECVTINEKLPFENASILELKEAQKIVRKRKKTNK